MKYIFAILIIISAAVSMPAAAHAKSYVIGVGCLGAENCRMPLIEEILNELYRRSGMEVEYRYYPLLRELISVNNGVTDASAGRTMAAINRYKNIVAVPEPLGEAGFSMYFMDRDPAPTGWESLKGLRVASVRGSLASSEKAREHGITTLLADSHKSGFEMLRRNSIDVLIANSITGDMHVSRQQNKSKIHSLPLFREKSYHVLNIKHRALLPELSRNLREMHEDGTFDAILHKWYSEQHPEHAPTP